MSKQSMWLCRYVYIVWIVNVFCVFVDIYQVYIGAIRQDGYWWSVFLLFLWAVCVNVFTNMYIINKAKVECKFDYLVPKWLKDYLCKRHITDAEYKSVVVFWVYAFFIFGNLPFSLCVVAYVLPVFIIAIVLIESRNFSKWSRYEEDGNHISDGELGAFKDYYLLLDINRDASEEAIDKSFNKAMAKYNSGIDGSLYGETYKRNVQEAYRVLSSTNRLRQEYDREFDAYRASNMSEYQYSDERTKRDIMLVQKELDRNLSVPTNYSSYVKAHNYVVRAVVIYGVLLAIVSVILFVPVKKHTTFGDVYWESLWDKMRFFDD